MSERTTSNIRLPIIARLHSSTLLHVVSGSTGYRVEARFIIESVGQADAAIEALQIIKSMLERIDA